MGFEILSQHMPRPVDAVNVLVEVPGGNLASPAKLTLIGQLEQKIAAAPDIQSVSSVVDPTARARFRTP